MTRDGHGRSWPPPKRLDYRRDGWFAFRFATQPWRSITRERLPRQRWSVDGKRVQLTVQNSHYPTFRGERKSFLARWVSHSTENLVVMSSRPNRGAGAGGEQRYRRSTFRLTLGLATTFRRPSNKLVGTPAY